MNYNVFKTLVDVLVKTYKCPNCSAEVNENSIDIVGAAGSTINVDIACPTCKQHSIIKAEATQVNANMMDFWANPNLESIKKSLSNLLVNRNRVVNENPIKDADIVSLNKDFKNPEIRVEDLFWE
jgi:hypothetical protein